MKSLSQRAFITHNHVLHRQDFNSRIGTFQSPILLPMTTSRLNMHANVAVRLDTPLLSPESFQPTPVVLWRTILLLITSDAFKAASSAFIVAFTMTFVAKVLTRNSNRNYMISWSRKFSQSITYKMKTIQSILQQIPEKIIPTTGILQSIHSQLKNARDRISKNIDDWSNQSNRMSRSSQTGSGVPMKFNSSDPITQGWGVCTLLSKKKVGRSRYMQYEFSLPYANNTLPLSLGQQITLSCLEADEKVVRGDFYLFSPRNGQGRFSVLLPDISHIPDASKTTGNGGGKLDSQALATLEYELGKDSGDFVSIVVKRLLFLFKLSL